MKRYFTIDYQLMIELGLTVQEWMILENIHFMFEQPTRKELAEYHQIGYRRLKDILDKLVDEKWLKTDSKNNLKTTSKYVKSMSKTDLHKTAGHGNIEPAQNCRSDLHKTAGSHTIYKKDRREREQDIPLRSINLSSKQDTKIHKPIKSYNQFLEDNKDDIESGDLPEVVLVYLDDYVEYRDEMFRDGSRAHAIKTKGVIKRYLLNLEKIYNEGIDIDEVIEEMKDNGWISFSPKIAIDRYKRSKL